MGTLLDTTVFIQFERRMRRRPAASAMADVSAWLVAALGEDEEVGMASITAAELLHGVHRADSSNRARREAFVETLLTAFPPIPYDLLCARIHARIWAEIASAGRDVGPHDRIVAATALSRGWRVATANVRHYAPIAGLITTPVLAEAPRRRPK